VPAFFRFVPGPVVGGASATVPVDPAGAAPYERRGSLVTRDGMTLVPTRSPRQGGTVANG
jgi:hypothetical protein